MTTHPWQLKKPINAIVFDCDGTLSSIEGINELAKLNSVGKEVEALTEVAMAQTGLNPELYEKRLQLVNPTQDQVLNLGQMYYAHKVPDIAEVLTIFKRLQKSIYLVSAGLYPSVKIFGELLGFSRENIFAVNIDFKIDGQFSDYERDSPLTRRDGKRDIVLNLRNQYDDIIFVGDGMNDLAALDLVTRFIGYGGSFYRKNIADKCQFYMNTVSMSPLLPLCLTSHEYSQLTATEQLLYDKGNQLIETRKVIIND